MRLILFVNAPPHRPTVRMSGLKPRDVPPPGSNWSSQDRSASNNPLTARLEHGCLRISANQATAAALNAPPNICRQVISILVSRGHGVWMFSQSRRVLQLLIKEVFVAEQPSRWVNTDSDGISRAMVGQSISVPLWLGNTVKQNCMNEKHDHSHAGFWATKQELAEHFRCSARYINMLMKQQVLPYVKLGKFVRFDISECDRAMRRFRAKSIFE